MSDISDTSDIADESLLSSSDDASVGCSPTGSLPDADDSFDPPDGHPTLINLPPPAQPPPNPPLTPAQRVLSIPELITLIATHHLSPAPFMNIRSINRTIRSAIDRSHATWRLAYGAMFDLQPALAQLVQKEAEEARTKLHCGGGRAWFRTSETGFNGWVGRYLLLLRMTARAGVVVVPVWVPAPGRRMVEMGFRGLEGNEAQMLFTLKAMMMISSATTRPRGFGIDQEIRADGGGSTRAMCKNKQKASRPAWEREIFAAVQGLQIQQIVRILKLGAGNLIQFERWTVQAEFVGKADDVAYRLSLKSPPICVSPLLNIVHLALAAFYFQDERLFKPRCVDLDHVAQTVFWPRKEVRLLQRKTGYRTMDDGLLMALLCFWQYVWSKSGVSGNFWRARMNLISAHYPSFWTGAVRSPEVTMAGDWFGAHAFSNNLERTRTGYSGYDSECIETSDISFLKIYTYAAAVPPALRQAMGPSPVQPLAMWVDEIFETPATKQKEPFLMSGSYYREDPGDPERLDRTRAQKFRRFVNVGNAQLLEPQYGSHLYSAGRSRWPHALNIPEYETMPGFRLLHFYQFADHDPSHAPQSSAGVSRLFHPTAWIAFEGIVTPGAAMAFGRWYKPDFPDASAGDHRCNILRGHSHRALDGQVSGPAFFWRNASAIPHPHHQLDAFEVPRSQLQADTLEEPEGGGAYGPETAAAMGTGERGGWRMLADLSGMDRADVYGRVDGLNAHLPRLEWEGDVWGPGVLDAEVALGRSGGRMWGGNGLDGELWGRARVWADRVADNIVADLRAARAEGAAVASVASVAGGAV